ncbi:MAG: hypothetical protein AAF950_07975 [Pseudomonadota bacterium]
MIWIFRALMAVGILVAILSVAIAALIFINVGLSDCGAECDGQSPYILLFPCIILGVIGCVIAFVASRIARRLKLERIAASKL